MKKFSYRQRQLILGWFFVIGCYFTLDGLILILPQINPATPGIRDLVVRYHTGVLLTFAFLASLRRAVAAHPLSTRGYLDWLRLTPWQPGMPLPKGPATLGLSDFVTVAVFTSAAHWNMPQGAEWTLTAFSLAYVLGGLSILAKANVTLELLIIAFIVPAFVWFIPSAMFMLIFSALMAAVMIVGMSRTFSKYPWESTAPKLITERWPLLQFRDTKPMVTIREGFIAALLLGLWSAAVTHQMHTRVVDAAPVIAMFVLGVSFLRFVIYLSKGPTPVSLLYRIFRGPLFFPRFDVIFIMPLLTALVGIGTLVATAVLRLQVEIVVGLTAFMTSAVALLAGPQLKIWQLTAFINVNVPRYRPPLASKNRSTAASS